MDRLSLGEVRRMVEASGVFGVFLFAAIFIVGELFHVPGMVFVGAGILAFGKLAGFFVALVAAIASISVSFWVVRAVGGRALAEIDADWVRRILAKLEDRPVTTVFVLRSLFWISPPLNYALALSNIRFRDYLLGSALGLVGPVTIAAVFFDWVFAALLS